MGVQWNAEGTTRLLQLILNNPVWRNALFSQSMFNQHKQYLTTQAICIEMFGNDLGWRNEWSREGLIKVKADGIVVATANWTSRIADPVRSRLYILKDWMKKGKFTKEYQVDSAWTSWKQVPRALRTKLQRQHPYYFDLHQLVSTSAPYAPPVRADPNNNASDHEGTPLRVATGSRRKRCRRQSTSIGDASDEASDDENGDETRSMAFTSSPAPKRPRRARENGVKAEHLETGRQFRAASGIRLNIGTAESPIHVVDDESDTALPLSSIHMSFHDSMATGRSDQGPAQQVKQEDTIDVVNSSAYQMDDVSGRVKRNARNGTSPQGSDHGVSPRRGLASPYALPAKDLRAPEMIRLDEAVGKITEAQILRRTKDYASAIHKGRMWRPPAELDLSSLGDLPAKFDMNDLHAYHHFFQGYSRLVQIKQHKIRNLLADTDIVAPSEAHDISWLGEVLKIAAACGGRVSPTISEPHRGVCFVIALWSPIRPRHLNGAPRAKYGYDGVISALNLLRFLDYTRLRRKWLRGGSVDLTVTEKFELGRAAESRDLQRIGAFSFDDWRWWISSNHSIRVRFLLEALEAAIQDV